MSEILPEPDLEFLSQDPTALREPDPLQPRDIPVAGIAAGLSAAYLGYRHHMRRQLQEEVTKLGPGVTRRALLAVVGSVWQAYIPSWVSKVVPLLVAGYLQGMREAATGEVPESVLRKIAEGYAEELGEHINSVSQEALISGFNAQVNRKVPAVLAARRVTDAYGVTRRTMNALVNVWTAKEEPRLTDLPLPSAKDERAKYIIETQNALRAQQVGETEAWTAKTQAKQVVWMYGQQKGVIPKSARRVWITAHDERVCPTCGPMDGKYAKIGEKFKTSDGDFWTPPAHVRCRCDVVLDLTPTEDMQDALDALLKAEKVSKARAGDPYDRDSRGRFSSVESRRAGGSRSRPFQEREAEVDALLSQVNQALRQPLQPLQQQKPTAAGDRIKLTPLKATHQLKPLKPVRLKPKEQKRVNLRSDLRQRLEQAPLRVNLRAAAALPTTIPLVPIKGDHPDSNFYPLPGHSLIGLYTPDSPKLWNLGEHLHTRRHQQFVEKHGVTLAPDEMNEIIEGQIQDSWLDWIETESGNYWENMEADKPRTYTDTETGQIYVIDPHSYERALEAAVYKVEHGEDVYLEPLYGAESRYGERGKSNRKKINAVELASYLRLDDLIYQNRPTLIEIQHISPYEMQSNKAGMETTAGISWEITGVREEDGTLHHLPYVVYELKPVGVEADDDDWFSYDGSKDPWML